MQRLDGEATELAHVLELVEAEAWADWLAATPPATAARLGVSALRLGSAVGGMTRGSDVLMYNRVVGLGVGEAATDAQIDELIARYGAAGVARWMVQWCPGARPARMADLLHACGFYHHNNWMKLHRRVSAPPPARRTDLRIERIGGEQRDAFAAILAAAYDYDSALTEWSAALVDRPSWRAFMAFDDDEPVAVGALFVHGRTGWLGFAGTHPQHRGRGAQAALIAARIANAAALGCELVVVETAEDLPSRPSPSFRNMRRLGFEVAYARPNYVMIAGTAAAGIIAEQRAIAHPSAGAMGSA